MSSQHFENAGRQDTETASQHTYVDSSVKPEKAGKEYTTTDGAPLTPVVTRPTEEPLGQRTSYMPHSSRHLSREISRSTGKKILTEADAFEDLGYCFPQWKKWMILSVIFAVQVSMNFNTSLFSDGIQGMSHEFDIKEQVARQGAMIFLVMYAFGCELWAPWSEELGRKPILQASLGLVNIWQIPVALAKNWPTVLVGRALGGLSTAGGSVTLGMVADMWDADAQQYAVAFAVFSSVGGSVFGPIVGGFVHTYLSWRWTIWIQLILGVTVQAVHFLFVPETRSTVMLDKIAKARRAKGEEVYGPNELRAFSERFDMHEVLLTWIRPFKMFLTEPIVLTLSLLSGFADGLIFMFFQSFGLVFEEWDFSHIDVGLVFVAMAIGYFLAYLSFIPAIQRNQKQRRANPDDERAQYEGRMWWLLFTAPCLPIGLIGFGWTATGPPIHWIAPVIFAAIIGVANYAIYMGTIDYMVAAYGPYSASATGGNGWSRDIIAGILTIPAVPFFKKIGPEGKHVPYACTILFAVSFILVGAVYWVYFTGPALRKRSPFAQQLHQEKEENGGIVPTATRGTV